MRDGNTSSPTRTIQFIDATIASLKEVDAVSGGYKLVSGVMARVRRNAIGVMLILGPFNYPVSKTQHLQSYHLNLHLNIFNYKYVVSLLTV